jgi:hypothetical protein
MSVTNGANGAAAATAASSDGTPGVGISGTYGLLDAESANLLGTYGSEPEALRVVADLARRYGVGTSAVASLVLYRTDVAEDESVIAEGENLVRRALARIDMGVPGGSP